MTKANECTCPSGDGSLRHPCPAHPAVEQAGGDERDLQGAQGERDGWGPLPLVQVPWNVFDRAVMWVEDRRRYGDDGTIVDDWKALKTIQRAALAQPSPAQAEAERLEVVGYRIMRAHADKIYQRVDKAAAEYEAGRSALGYMEDIAEAALCLRNRLDDLLAAPVAQAQRSVPEEFSFEYRHPNGECHTVTVSREQVINEMPDFMFEALCSKLCNCEPVGETNVVECRCDEYAEEFKLIAAAPGNEGV